jgi:hypothetical protein
MSDQAEMRPDAPSRRTPIGDPILATQPLADEVVQAATS